MKKYLPLLLITAALAALTAFSAQAAEGARRGLAVCAASLIPSLLPFFVLTRLLSSMGLTDILSRRAGGLTQRLFRVSGAGAQAFLLGLSGGYPLGATVTASLRRDRLVSREEAERLLAFCNNSGPAFILGAAGGVFRSPKAGLLLFVTHILGAVCTGLLFRGRGGPASGSTPRPAEPLAFPQAFPAAVSGAVNAILAVTGYVVLFSALVGMLPIPEALPSLYRAMAVGVWELGSGIAALAGSPPAPDSLAAAAFLLGWGGVSVHCQTLGAVAGTDIRCARHLAGRALCGCIAAVFTYVLAVPMFQ